MNNLRSSYVEFFAGLTDEDKYIELSNLFTELLDIAQPIAIEDIIIEAHIALIASGDFEIKECENCEDKKTEYNKNYYEKNKERLRNKNRERYQKNKDKIKQKYQENKAKYSTPAS